MQQNPFGSVTPRESLDSKCKVSGICGAERDVPEGESNTPVGTRSYIHSSCSAVGLMWALTLEVSLTIIFKLLVGRQR